VRERRNLTPDPPHPAADDLQKIAGIGTALAARLAGAGVTTYRDLASHTPQRLAALTRVPSGKIVSQNWIGQAQRLAGAELVDPEDQQKYATFHIELLIDPDNTVRRTRTRHYQTDTEDSWPGWDGQRLIAVIHRKAALDPPDVSFVPDDLSVPDIPSASLSSTQPAPPVIHAEGPSPSEEGTRGTFRVAGEPTAARMTFRVWPGLDAGDVDFTAEVAARSLADGHRHPLATACGTAAIDQPVTLELAGPPLPQGIYRLEAMINIYGHRHRPADTPLDRCRVPGDLIHVTGRRARPSAAVARRRGAQARR
jgi:Helix-hairpin-helix domain